GPVITLAESMPSPDKIAIRMTIERQGDRLFEGSTSIAEMARSFDDLISWLGKDNSFPHGVILLTGTGIVPPDTFALAPGDLGVMAGNGIGRRTNLVERKG